MERQRKRHITSSISTKFRKVIQENRVGVLQDRLFWLTTFHVDQGWNVWSEFHKIRHFKGWQHFILIRIETRDLRITSHKCSIFLSRCGGAIFHQKTFGLMTSRRFRIKCTLLCSCRWNSQLSSWRRKGWRWCYKTLRPVNYTPSQ